MEQDTIVFKAGSQDGIDEEGKEVIYSPLGTMWQLFNTASSHEGTVLFKTPYAISKNSCQEGMQLVLISHEGGNNYPALVGVINKLGGKYPDEWNNKNGQYFQPAKCFETFSATTCIELKNVRLVSNFDVENYAYCPKSGDGQNASGLREGDSLKEALKRWEGSETNRVYFKRISD
ncbi:hypothetical protein OZX57_02240 [Bifidobacterium sp. ESL0682]|uniref:hypothetical protein n=1 Tax=Bifidobacterium sp. ESL0682 TaxID=2983212 RepID=UPI0023F66D36|nr:hypothetical protein [Bifidobacterium sp. ESL0682]WEV42315.1 hypothetical protein OZX57_02240 [Bifidobacterium sp. ESL0682]